MRPLNADERRRAFWRFLLFYAITLLTIIGIVYLGFCIPAMQDKELRAQVASFQKQQQYAASFTSLLESVNDYEKQSQTTDENDGKIKQSLIAMQTFADNDSIQVKDFYNDVMHILMNIQVNNQQIRIAKTKTTYLKTLMLANNKLDRDLQKNQKDASTKAQNNAKKPAAKINFNSKLQAMLDSVMKFKQPVIESFNQYLCNGASTPVIVNDQKGHTFKDLYNEFKKHKKGTLLGVTTETDKNCVKQIIIKWKNNAFLGSNKLF